MLLGIDEFKLIQLTQPFTPGSEVHGIVPVIS